MTWRDTHDDDAFVDVAYSELVADPIGVVRAIYAREDTALGSEAESAMQAYLDAHPRGEHGRHRYDPEALGLDAGAIRERFATYSSRFAT
jgi:hypothetical protein